jgi:hypothetical protein
MVGSGVAATGAAAGIGEIGPTTGIAPEKGRIEVRSRVRAEAVSMGTIS